MADTVVRKYKKEDRPWVREIAVNTAFIGESAAIFFDDKEIFADLLTRYFTDCEPGSCFVAEDNGLVVGYLTGAKDENILKKIFVSKILPPLLAGVVFKGIIFRRKNRIFILSYLRSVLKGEFNNPDFSGMYPATLHINLKEGFQNRGIGSRLMVAYLDYLVKEGVRGIHLATMSEKAGKFFVKNGFALLYTAPRSYFNYILHRDTPIYIYAKKL